MFGGGGICTTRKWVVENDNATYGRDAPTQTYLPPKSELARVIKMDGWCLYFLRTISWPKGELGEDENESGVLCEDNLITSNFTTTLGYYLESDTLTHDAQLRSPRNEMRSYNSGPIVPKADKPLLTRWFARHQTRLLDGTGTNTFWLVIMPSPRHYRTLPST